MKATLLGIALAAISVPALADVTLYGRPGFEGRSVTTREPIRDLEAADFANRASSLVIRDGSYEFCSGREFQDRCVVLGPGRYPSLEVMGMNDAIVSLRPKVAEVAPGDGEVTLYGREGFAGRSFATRQPVRNLERFDFNDRASSVIVQGGRFEICDDAGFQGRCMVLRPGQYPSLAAMGMDRAISSVRPVSRQAQPEERRFAPPPPVAYDYRRRGDERLFEAEVLRVHAVYGRPEQRCWVERESVRDDVIINGPGSAVIGGFLGHQSGGVEVRRCTSNQVSGPPQYWDVAYRFRGAERSVQMTHPPGATITVNGEGEPRAD